eukprot:3484484-Lingulodinium_polyedra.AAC.1
MGRASFEDAQMAHGFNHEPESLLQDRKLDQRSRPLAYDQMHVLVVNGIAQNQTATSLATL